MKVYKIIIKVFFSIVFIWSVIPLNLHAQSVGDYRSAATGDWDVRANWERFNGILWLTPGVLEGYPGQFGGTGDVQISDGDIITLNVDPANPIGSLTFEAGSSTATELNFNGSDTLEVTGAVTFTAPGGNNGDQTLDVEDGQLICASVTMSNTGNNNRDLTLRINSGSLVCNGDFTMNGSTARNALIFDGNGVWELGGSYLTSGLVDINGNTPIVRFTGAGAETFRGMALHHVEVTGGGTYTRSAANLDIAGDLTISNGTLDPDAGNLTVTGVTTIDGTYNDGSNTGTNTFNSLVTINATGNWNSTVETGTAALLFNAGVVNDGTMTLGAVTLGAGQTMTANTPISITNGFADGGGNIFIAGAGGVSQSGTNITFSADVTINAGSSFTKSGNNLIINGAFNVNGDFIDDDNAGNNQFIGLVTIGAAGTWNTSAVITMGRVDFEGGITLNNTTPGAFVSSRVRFSGSSQSLSGAGELEFFDDVEIQGAIVVTNNCTDTVVIWGSLSSNDPSGEWEAGTNSILDYKSATEPFSGNGILDLTSNTPNEMIYSGGFQTLDDVTYHNLTINCTGTSALSAGGTVNNELALGRGVLDGTNLTMANASKIIRYAGSMSVAPTFPVNPNTINVEYRSDVVTGLELPSVNDILDNLIINNGGGTVSLGANVTVIGQLQLNDGRLTLETYNCTIDDGASITTSASFSNTNMIETNSTGLLVKSGSADGEFVMTYPLGNGTLYSPMIISSITTSGGLPDNLEVRAVPSKVSYIPITTNALTKYWEVTEPGTVTGVDVNFTYVDPDEVVGVQANYEPRRGDGIATMNVVSGASAAGVNPFSTIGNATLTGDWTALDPIAATPTTLYSYQTGSWGTANTWTEDPSGTLLINPRVPGSVALDDVVILTGRIVTVSASRNVNDVTINSGGTLDLGTTTSNNYTSLSGQGVLKVNTTSLPNADLSVFVASGGGTVEYYDIGGAGTQLSSSQLEYNNIKISNSTGTDHTLIFPNTTNPTNYTINGDVIITRTGAGDATLRLGHTATNSINLDIDGNIDVDAGGNFTVGNFAAIHQVTLQGDLTNDGVIDWSNAAQYSDASASGAVNLISDGANNSIYTCNSRTDVYSLEVDKGVDQTYQLEVNASAVANFKFFTDGSNTTSANNEGLFVNNGTLKLTGSTAFTKFRGGGSTGQYDICRNSGTGKLWVDGADCSLGHALRIYGDLEVSGGTLVCTSVGINMMNNSSVTIGGGTTTIKQLNSAGSGVANTSFTMTGGVLNFDESLAGGDVADAPRWSMGDVDANIDIQGGIINIYDPHESASNIDNGGIAIGGVPSNISVTGGTWNIYIPASAIDFNIASTMPFYNLNIYKEGAGTAVCKIANIEADLSVQAQDLVVLNDLYIDGTNAPVLDANGNDVYIGGNFTVASGGTYSPGGNTTYFNGNADQTFTIDQQINEATHLQCNKSSGDLIMAGSADFDGLNSLTQQSGIIRDGGLDLDVIGTINANDSLTGTGSIILQRGVTSVSVTSGGSYSVPAIRPAGGGSNAEFNVVITDGVITDISISNGGSGYSNGLCTYAGGAGVGAEIRCQVNGSGTVTDVWIIQGGSGYGPTATPSSGSAAFEVIVSGVADNTPSSFPVTAVNLVSTGSGYTAVPTVNFSSGAATATAICGTATIAGDGSGVFTNLSLNNDAGANVTANFDVVGDLRLVDGNLMLASSNLLLGASSSVYDALGGTSTAGLGGSGNQMITTSGNSSDGGVTKVFSATSFTFPVGTAMDYTPATFTFSGAPTTYGSITVNAVTQEHPLVSSSGHSLTYYWKVRQNGFNLGAETVSPSFVYVDSDIAGDEVDYVPGRYNPSTVSWSKTTSADVTTASNTASFADATFNTEISGDYTVGDDNPTDPFAAILTFYSRNGSSFNWSDGNAWSTTGHAGAAAGLEPTANSIVQIGDGVTYDHTVLVDKDSAMCGALRIAVGSILDLDTFKHHDFGTYTSLAIGDGTLRLASDSSTILFPAGDFGSLLDVTGGVIEFYTINGQSYTIPNVSEAPSNLDLDEFYNLTLIPATGDTITMGDANLTVHNNLNINGGSSTGFVLLNSVSSKILDIGNDLLITTGNLQFFNSNSQAITIDSNLTISTNGVFDIATTGSSIVNTIQIGKSLSNEGDLDFANGTDVCDITFIGTSNESITGAVGGANMDVHKITVNKGTSQAPVLTLDYAGTFSNGAVDNEWLVLANGTFRWEKGASVTINDGDGLDFDIPSTACLSVNHVAADVNICQWNGDNTDTDLNLSGRLEVVDGDVSIGVDGANRDNSIMYSAAGTPEIDVQGGTLTVTSQIQRSTVSTAGNLFYSQSGGVVSVRGSRRDGARGIFEIDNGGDFTMSSGTLTVCRGGGTTFNDIYIHPATSNVTGGTLQIGDGTTNGGAVIELNTDVALYDVYVEGSTTHTAQLQTNGLTIQNNLTIDASTIFDANGEDVIILGNLINSNTDNNPGPTTGGYQAGTITQTTTFNSTTGGQTITGVLGNRTNFANLVVNNTSTGLTLAANTNVLVNNKLTTTNGDIADGGNMITVVGDIEHNTVHSGSGSIMLSGIGSQTLSGDGTGEFQNLTLNNSNNFITSANFTVNGVLTFTDGVLSIGSNKLTFGASATVGGTPSSSTMIETSGVTSVAGVVKNFPASALDFTFPIGSAGKYTPARFNVTANSAVGTITVKPVNAKHPSTQDAGNFELDYYWNVSSTGFSGLTVTHEYTYDNSDVNGTEASYVVGRFYPLDWSPAGGGEAATSVTAGSDLITLTGKAYLDGAYTAGETSEFAALFTYYSRNATLGGDWDDVNSWSTTGHGGVAAVSTPNGNPVVIASGHTINANGDLRVAVSARIDGELFLDNYVGHNFVLMSGTGVLRLNPTGASAYVMPGGDLSAFVSDTGGTVQFDGGNATLPAVYAFNNLQISGVASTKTLNTSNYAINGDLTIDAASILSNSANNINIDILGDWINNNGTAGFVSGTGEVDFSNVSAGQSITGETDFYNLEISNSGQTVTMNNDVDINNQLNFSTAGFIDVNGNDLTIDNWNNGDVVTLGTDRYVALSSNGTFTINGVNAGETANFLAGFSTTTTDFARVDVANSDGANTSFIYSVCDYVNLSGTCSGGTEQTDGTVDLTYNITSSSTNATVTLYWDESRELGTFSNSSVSMNHYTGGTWNIIGSTGSATNLAGDIYYWSAPTTSFSPFAMSKNGDVLPVELLHFNVEREGDNVQVSWGTSAEINNDYFVVERSENGLDYYLLGVVESQTGNGNSNSNLFYDLLDSDPIHGISYYRIKQVDLDGTSTIYGPRVVVFDHEMEWTETTSELSVFPNPSKRGENIQIVSLGDFGKNQAIKIKVADVQGRTVYSDLATANSEGQVRYTMFLDGKLSKGFYLIELISQQKAVNKIFMVK